MGGGERLRAWDEGALRAGELWSLSKPRDCGGGGLFAGDFRDWESPAREKDLLGKREVRVGGGIRLGIGDGFAGAGRVRVGVVGVGVLGVVRPLVDRAWEEGFFGWLLFPPPFPLALEGLGGGMRGGGVVVDGVEWRGGGGSGPGEEAVADRDKNNVTDNVTVLRYLSE